MSLERPNFTTVPNSLIDSHMSSLSECELKVILYILRKTYGFHREQVTVSLARISEHIGMDRATISRACRNLSDLGVLIATKNSQDGSVVASTYEPNFDSDLEGGGVAPTQHPIDLSATGGVAPGSTVKEERNTTEINTASPSPTPSFQTEDLNLEDPIEVFVVNAYRRNGRGKLKLNRRADQLTVENLQRGEEKYGAEHYRRCLLGFLANESAWLKENKWPLNAFLKSPESYEPTVGEPWVDPGPTPQAPVVEFHQPPTTGTAEPLPHDFFVVWNKAVPGLSTEYSPNKAQLLVRAVTDPEFVANFQLLCERANLLCKTKGDQASYADLYWMVSTKVGEMRPNWHRLLFGNLRHMTASPVNSHVGQKSQWKPGMIAETEEDLKVLIAWKRERRAQGLPTDPDKYAAQGGA